MQDKSWRRRVIAVLAIAVGLGSVVVRGSGAGAANVTFPSSWTNPVGSATFEDWGFDSCTPPYVPGKAHLGADSQGTVPNQQAVAIASGTVVRVVGSNWGPGGAAGIVHAAADGTQFLMVYGHLNLQVAVGTTVAAGSPVGRHCCIKRSARPWWGSAGRFRGESPRGRAESTLSGARTTSREPERRTARP